MPSHPSQKFVRRNAGHHRKTRNVQFGDDYRTMGNQEILRSAKSKPFGTFGIAFDQLHGAWNWETMKFFLR